MSVQHSCVYLVGAGPGDIGLVTLRARQLVEVADVIFYDYLCNPEILRWARPECQVVYVGKSASNHTFSQKEINQLLINHAREGKIVVRLKGGDPYVFGRGGEEAQDLVEAGVDFQEVPGVTSAVAAPAYAGIPVTHRDHTSLLTLVTGHEDPEKEASSIPWRELAHLGGTIVFLMGVERLRTICDKLLDQCADPNLPVALVRWGTTPRQESIEGTLATIADIAEQRRFRPPAVIIVGEVVRLRRHLNWFESLPLFGQRIVVTRTREQSSRLSELLRAQGADVLEIPTIEIRPMPWSHENLAAIQVLPDHFQWIVFTSPNGVDAFFEKLIEAQGDVRALGSVKLAAVGPSTQEKLAKWHVRPSFMPTVFRARELAEGLLKQFGPNFQKLLLVQGNRNDPELETSLEEAGHHVTAWQLYETIPAKDLGSIARVRYEKEGANWILFASSSAVEHWHDLGLTTEGLQPHIASIGPSTTEAIKRLGYSLKLEAPTATIPALVDALKNVVAKGVRRA